MHGLPHVPNGNKSQAWVSSLSYNSTTGAYKGTATTNGVGGEWVQMQWPLPVSPSNFTMSSNANTISLFGSYDNVTWTRIDAPCNAFAPFSPPPLPPPMPPLPPPTPPPAPFAGRR